MHMYQQLQQRNVYTSLPHADSNLPKGSLFQTGMEPAAWRPWGPAGAANRLRASSNQAGQGPIWLLWWHPPVTRETLGCGARRASPAIALFNPRHPHHT
jgi:hypothetical protein